MSHSPDPAASTADSVGPVSQESFVNGSGPTDFEGGSGQPAQQYPTTNRYQEYSSSQHAFSSHSDMTTPSSSGRPAPYNMAPLANALPQSGYRPVHYAQGGQQNYMNPATSPAMIHQVSQGSQYGSLGSMPMPGPGYYVQQTHMNQYYGGQMPTHGHANMASRQGMPYYSNHVMMNPPQPGYYYPQPVQYGNQHQNMPTTGIPAQYVAASPTLSDPRAFNPSSDAEYSMQAAKHGNDDEEHRQSAVRGPPRKPKQSGHAIWIGNLPPQTDLMSLVHHVCKEAPGLESLFLISKSNCAFANFKDESTCVTAQQKLHDSKFQSIRLVSRLRKSTVEGAAGMTAPTGPAAVTTIIPPQIEQTHSTPTESGNGALPASQVSQAKNNLIGGGTPRQDKFFILKSLTVEDLEHSVKTGIWATQSHNEDGLNNAFKNSDNVYLVFSANKSGEYFGYARMTSEINDDPEAAIEFAPKTQEPNDVDLPRAIVTDGTEFAPKGRIIDDSARGTIFWEADRGDSDSGSDTESDAQSTKSGGLEEGAKTWGKPFKLEWLSNTRLPFYRTRGLRNPWNSNREVKIARDGTELEPSVGRRLIGLFNRIQSPGQVPAGMRPPMSMIAGFPQTRPYGP